MAGYRLRSESGTVAPLNQYRFAMAKCSSNSTALRLAIGMLILAAFAACETEEPDAEMAVDDIAVVLDSAAAYEGRTVQFTDVNVQDVVGDSIFWIGPTSEQRLFVLLIEQRTPDTPTEGRYNINSGQTISITGTLRSIPPADTLAGWGLDEAARTELQNQHLYLEAQRASDVPNPTSSDASRGASVPATS